MADYQSKYSDGTCSAAQKLTEMMLERQASKKKIVLPPRFWKVEKWKREYQRQIIRANYWLKSYDAEVIFRALKAKKNQWINSLYYKGINELCVIAQAEIEREKANLKVIEATDNTNVESRPSLGRKTILSKLRKSE